MGRVDSIDPGQHQIHQHDVRSELGAERHRIRPIGGLTDQLHALLPLQGNLDPPAQQLVVIDHHYSDGSFVSQSRPLCVSKNSTKMRDYRKTGDGSTNRWLQRSREVVQGRKIEKDTLNGHPLPNPGGGDFWRRGMERIHLLTKVSRLGLWDRRFIDLPSLHVAYQESVNVISTSYSGPWGLKSPRDSAKWPLDLPPGVFRHPWSPRTIPFACGCELPMQRLPIAKATVPRA